MSSATMVPASYRHRLPERLPAADEYVSWGLVTGLVRRRWPAFLLALVVSVGLAALYLALTPPTYEAGASLLIEEEQYNIPDLMKRLTNESGVNTEVEVLRSARLTEAVARELALQVSVEASRAAPRTPLSAFGVNLPAGASTAAPRSRLLSDLAVADSADSATIVLNHVGDNRFAVAGAVSGAAGEVAIGKPATVGTVSFTLLPEAADYQKIQLNVSSLRTAVMALQDQVKVIRPDRDVKVIWIRYRSQDPALAGLVPDRLAEHYIMSRAERAKAKAQTAVKFLRGQADTLQSQLLAADQSLRNYRETAGIVSLPEEAVATVSSSSELSTSRTKIESERSSLGALLSEAEATPPASDQPSPYRGLTAFPTLIGNPVVADLLHTLSDLEDQRAQLLLRRTAEDPDAVANAHRIASVDEQLHGLTQTYLKGLQGQVASLDGALRDRASFASRIPTKSMQEERLSRKPRLLSDVSSMVETRLQEARIAESAADPGVTIIDRAGIPTEPVWPRKGVILVVAIAVGLLIGGATAWAREGMDGTVHSRADVIRASEVRVLGLVPHIKMVRDRGREPILLSPGRDGAFAQRFRRRTKAERSRQSLLVNGMDPTGTAQEAYAWLENSLDLTSRTEGLRTLAFTSPLAREGKTINALNLALTMARRGKKVLLIDADLRRGMIQNLLGFTGEIGLADVLGGRVPLDRAIRRIPLGGEVALNILQSGTRGGNPGALLRPAGLRVVLDAVESRYDLIIIDTPPVNLVSDAMLFAGLVDGVVLVARAGVTDAAALTEASRHLREAGAPLLGVVLNDIDLRRDSSYDESYRYLDQAGEYATVVEG